MATDRVQRSVVVKPSRAFRTAALAAIDELLKDAEGADSAVVEFRTAAAAIHELAQDPAWDVDPEQLQQSVLILNTAVTDMIMALLRTCAKVQRLEAIADLVTSTNSGNAN